MRARGPSGSRHCLLVQVGGNASCGRASFDVVPDHGANSGEPKAQKGGYKAGRSLCSTLGAGTGLEIEKGGVACPVEPAMEPCPKHRTWPRPTGCWKRRIDAGSDG